MIADEKGETAVAATVLHSAPSSALSAELVVPVYVDHSSTTLVHVGATTLFAPIAGAQVVYFSRPHGYDIMHLVDHAYGANTVRPTLSYDAVVVYYSRLDGTDVVQQDDPLSLVF